MLKIDRGGGDKLHAAAAKLLHSSPPSTDRACAAAF
jgi:hypothetical protein